MVTSVRSICSEDALLHVDGQLVVADLDEVRVADFLEAPVLLPRPVLDHAYPVHRTHAYHVMGLGLQLGCLAEHLLGSVLEVLIAAELEHAHLPPHLNDLLDGLLVDLLEEAHLEAFLQIVSGRGAAILELGDLLVGVLVEDDLGTERGRRAVQLGSALASR